MPQPDTKDVRRPLELLGLSAVVAAFIFLVVLMGTRQPLLALEFAGVAFIVALVVLAMLALAVRPDRAERADIDEQDRDQGPPGH